MCGRSAARCLRAVILCRCQFYPAQINALFAGAESNGGGIAYGIQWNPDISGEEITGAHGQNS